MENIIYQSDTAKMYIRFTEDKGEDYPKPFSSFIIGVEMKFPSWVGQEVTCQGEEGFNMIGKDFLEELKAQKENYKVKIIRFEDALQDTDAYIVFDCKTDKVIVSGQLGATFENLFVTKFNFEADSSILINLYEVLRENTIY